jgi:subtilisin-like proprotein convertase family protein
MAPTFRQQKHGPGKQKVAALTRLSFGLASLDLPLAERDAIPGDGSFVDTGPATPQAVVGVPDPGLAGPPAHAEAAARLAAPRDALLGQQWNLVGATAVSIKPGRVWEAYDGTGIRLGIIDDGFDVGHPDIIGHYDRAGSYDFRDGDGDAGAGPGQNHGTAVLGVGAAAANGTGVVGVAGGATVVGIRIGYDSAAPWSQYADSLNHAWRTSDAVNMSWGFTEPFADNFAQNGWYGPLRQALRDGADLGRGGLGTVWVTAAGNGRAWGDNVNHHNMQNDIRVMAVAATDQAGQVAPFSMPGEALHVSAPGVAILTTDVTGAAGYAPGDNAYVQGTSFAAPAVWGTVALMLEANRGLGWRDVQEILALTARQTDAASPRWGFNQAGDWNGGGRHFSADHGFGLISTEAAVRLAETWAPGGTTATMRTLSAGASDGRAFDAGTVSSRIAIAEEIEVQKATVSISLKHTWIGDLRISLVSAEGTESVLLDRPGAAPGTAVAGVRTGHATDDIAFDLTSNRFWGEMSRGDWTLRVEDMVTGEGGLFTAWQLRLHGDAAGADDTYVYTDAYTSLGRQGTRMWLQDADGGVDTLNFSATSHTVWINLAPGGGGLVGGTALAIAAGTQVENVFGGLGPDVLVGNAAGNVIRGGLGDDHLVGGAGADRFVVARQGGHDVVADFSRAEGDLIRLTQGVQVASLAGTVARFNDGGSLASGNGHAWSPTDFTAQDAWLVA